MLAEYLGLVCAENVITLALQGQADLLTDITCRASDQGNLRYCAVDGHSGLISVVARTALLLRRPTQAGNAVRRGDRVA